MQTRKPILILAVLVVLAVAPVLSFAQGTPAPSFTPEQLDKLVARIALYPDALLAQVLAATTYSDQIPDAARWADQHHYLTGQALANAIQADHLPWDPSVQALLPFPSVLEMMANDMSWTTDLGSPVSGLAIVTVAPGTTALVVSRTLPTMALVVSPCPSASAGRRHATLNTKGAKQRTRVIDSPLICPKAAMFVCS